MKAATRGVAGYSIQFRWVPLSSGGGHDGDAARPCRHAPGGITVWLGRFRDVFPEVAVDGGGGDAERVGNLLSGVTAFAVFVEFVVHLSG